MSRPLLLRVDLDTLPAAISESIRACLAAHGFPTSSDLLRECGRNVAQMLTSHELAEEILLDVARAAVEVQP